MADPIKLYLNPAKSGIQLNTEDRLIQNNIQVFAENPDHRPVRADTILTYTSSSPTMLITASNDQQEGWPKAKKSASVTIYTYKKSSLVADDHDQDKHYIVTEARENNATKQSFEVSLDTAIPTLNVPVLDSKYDNPTIYTKDDGSGPTVAWWHAKSNMSLTAGYTTARSQESSSVIILELPCYRGEETENDGYDGIFIENTSYNDRVLLTAGSYCDKDIIIEGIPEEYLDTNSGTSLSNLEPKIIFNSNEAEGGAAVIASLEYPAFTYALTQGKIQSEELLLDPVNLTIDYATNADGENINGEDGKGNYYWTLRAETTRGWATGGETAGFDVTIPLLTYSEPSTTGPVYDDTNDELAIWTFSTELSKGYNPYRKGISTTLEVPCGWLGVDSFYISDESRGEVYCRVTANEGYLFSSSYIEDTFELPSAELDARIIEIDTEGTVRVEVFADTAGWFVTNGDNGIETTAQIESATITDYWDYSQYSRTIWCNIEAEPGILLPNNYEDGGYFYYNSFFMDYPDTLQSYNIKSGVEIFGITGTYTGTTISYPSVANAYYSGGKWYPQN